MAAFQSTNQPKLLAFEYVLMNLLKWKEEAYVNSRGNDLSTLKSIKLLFFVTAVNAKENNPNMLLNSAFNNFVAMPYGHVESGIYEEIRIRNGKLNYYQINNTNTVPLPNVNLKELETKISGTIKSEILKSISDLKKMNFDLINLSAYELVDLSHNWYSWKKTFSRAEMVGSSSAPIPKEVIIQEDKFFSLQVF